MEVTEIDKLAPLPPHRLLRIQVHPDRPVYVETSSVGLGGVFLRVLDAVDGLVLLEVCFGFDPAREVEVGWAILVATTNGCPTV